MRKGRNDPIVFPATRLVAVHPSSARKRHRIEDPLLLLLRMLLIAALTLLAASPFVQCSRLSLERTNGGNVSAALIIDDSSSMRAVGEGGESKLEQALTLAENLLQTARPGDSFAIILAGAPARVHTPPTTERESVRDALLSISASDRSTDLAGALALGRSLQQDALQKDRHLVLLSDLAGENLNQLDLTDVLPPPKSLTQPFENCALTSATHTTDAVVVETACTSQEALKDRTVTVLGKQGEPLAPPVPVKDGATRIPLPKKQQSFELREARVLLSRPSLAARDSISQDDSTAVLEAPSGLAVAVRADPDSAGRKTGTATLLQSGLESLDDRPRVRMLNLLPDREEDLREFSALFIDDPSGFTPEVRDAINTWTLKGGVAVALLGPGVERTPLGSDFHPFLSSALTYEATKETGVDPEKSHSLGPLAQTWTDLGAKRRVIFSTPDNAIEKATWKDGAPLLVELHHGRGLLLTASLPSSADRSDFALRPAFVELLDYAVREAAVRRGALAAPVGTRWRIPEGQTVKNPEGETLTPVSDPARTGKELREFEPALAGRYSITDGAGSDSSVEHRYAMREARESVAQPEPLGSDLRAASESVQLSKVGISREIALFCLILSLLELAFRVFLRSRAAGSLLRAET